MGARLVSPGGAPAGQALDLSRHGAMLRLASADLAALYVAPEPSETAGMGMLDISRLLGDGFDVEFVAGFRVRARLVRISWRPGDEDGVYLGCEFLDPLDSAALARLGLSEEHCPPEVGVTTPPAALMSHVPDPLWPLFLSVLDSAGRPLYSGPLVGLQESALATRLAPVDPTSLVARLSGKAHTVSIVPRHGRTWTSPAYLLAVRLLEGRSDGVEVVLTATTKPNRAVVRSMQRSRRS